MDTHAAVSGRKTILGLTALLFAAAPAAAQNMQATGHMHAEIGTLEFVDDGNTLITTAYPTSDGEEIRRKFRTDETTLVQGLGQIMSMDEIPQSALGTVVVVEFIPGTNPPVAHTLQFPDARQIQVTQGIVQEVDAEGRELQILNSEGSRELELGMGYGATIDSPRGLLDISDLQRGDEVIAYFDDPGMVDPSVPDEDTSFAYLLYAPS